MAVTVREHLADSALSAPVTIVTGSGTQADDVLLALHFTAFYPAADMLAPSGGGTWNGPIAIARNDSSNAPHIKAWWCALTTGGAKSIDFNHAEGDPPHNAVLFVLDGADTTDPISGSDVLDDGFGATQVAPSVAGEDDGVLVSGWVSDDLVTYTAPGTMTGLETDNGFNTAMGAYELLTATGATGTRTATSSAAKTHSAISVAIASAPVGGATGEIAGTLPELTGDLAGVASAVGTVADALPELTSTLAGAASAAGVVAGALPELDGQLAGVGSVAGAVAGDLPELAGALTGESDAVAGTVAGDLPELAGALAGAGTGLVLLSGNLPELAGTLDGTVAGVATGTVGGDLPALDGQLAGAGSVAGVITGALPELVGPLVGIREGAVATRLRALQTTTLDIYAPAVAPDEWSGARTDDSLVAGGVPASIIEQTRTRNDPRTGTPRIIREVTGRVPDGTEIASTSRVVDGEGRHYAVAAVRQPRNPLWTSDVILDLVRTDQQSP